MFKKLTPEEARIYDYKRGDIVYSPSWKHHLLEIEGMIFDVLDIFDEKSIVCRKSNGEIWILPEDQIEPLPNICAADIGIIRKPVSNPKWSERMEMYENKPVEISYITKSGFAIYGSDLLFDVTWFEPIYGNDERYIEVCKEVVRLKNCDNHKEAYRNARKF